MYVDRSQNESIRDTSPPLPPLSSSNIILYTEKEAQRKKGYTSLYTSKKHIECSTVKVPQ